MCARGVWFCPGQEGLVSGSISYKWTADSYSTVNFTHKTARELDLYRAEGKFQNQEISAEVKYFVIMWVSFLPLQPAQPSPT
jgi:hypothetical protein